MFRRYSRESPQPGMSLSILHSGEADFLVDAFVAADLAEHVGQRIVGSVAGRDRRAEWSGLPLRMLGDQCRVLVLGVILDVGVEPVAPGRFQHPQQPELLVHGEGDELRKEPEPDRVSVDAIGGNLFLEQDDVPFLVVLLSAVLVHRAEQFLSPGPAAAPLIGLEIYRLLPGWSWLRLCPAHL